MTQGHWMLHIVRNPYGHSKAEIGEARIALADNFESLENALRGLNHMGGDERGGYCICPMNDGSAPQYRHASSCQDARAALDAIDKERSK